MKALLICPAYRPAVELLGQTAPLSNVPLLGQTLLEYWFSHLACSGVKQIAVLTNDRPEEVRAIVRNGARWGIAAKVIEESRELTPAQALLKHDKELEPNSSQGISVLDHFPGNPQYPLFASYRAFFTALREWMTRAISPDRVGVREIQSGIWVAAQSHISPEAKLVAPCWISKGAFVGPRSVIGPNAILEDGAFIEPDSAIAHSIISSHTFVGRFSEMAGSIALGSNLINWSTGSIVKVPDPFVLCALRRTAPRRASKWLARLAELYSGGREEDHALAKQLLMNKGGQSGQNLSS